MLSFVFRRIIWGVVVLLMVVLLVSSIIYLAPVDPTRLTFGQRSDIQTIENKRKELGLDQSLSVQLRYYLRDLSPIALHKTEQLKENDRIKHISILEFEDSKLVLKWPYLRESYQSGADVWQLLSIAIPKTIILALIAFVLATLFGILFGIVAAINKDRFIDRFLLLTSSLGYSVPSYVSAMMLALIFGYWLKDWTGLNVQGSLVELNDMGDDMVVWKNLLLPAIALGVRPLSVIIQLTRASFLDVLNEPFIKTAIAKGLNFKKVITRHTLRNSLNPITSSLSGWLASMLAGAFFVEQVFNYKGVGSLTVSALISYDIPVVLACVIFIAAIFILINLMVDLLYVLIDPRISLN